MTFLFSVKLLLKEQLHWVCKGGSTLKAWQDEIDMGYSGICVAWREKTIKKGVCLKIRYPIGTPKSVGESSFSNSDRPIWSKLAELAMKRGAPATEVPLGKWNQPWQRLCFLIQNWGFSTLRYDIWYNYHTLYELLYIEYVYNDTMNKHDDTKTITITAIALMYIYICLHLMIQRIYYIVLYIYCTISYYIALYCIILYCAILYCIILYCIIYYIMLYYIIFILYYVILYLYSYSYLYYVYIIFSIFRYWYPDLPVVPCKEDSHHLSANQHREAHPHV